MRFFFLWGTGANGKTVFLNILNALLGDYATIAPMDMLLHSKGDRHPTDLAGLRGARLVTVSEIEKGRRWDEAKIKSLTGGDPIAARFMRQDFFNYTPQFKLLIAGNDKPAIRDVDEAMKRRLHLIPFTVTIPPNGRDPKLTGKLLSEKDAILNWAVEGCLEWQKFGLCPPDRVVEATNEYLESEDVLGRWIEEACETKPNVQTTTRELFNIWKVWTEHWGEQTGSMRKFSTDMEKRGFKRWKSGNQRGFRGIVIPRQETE